MKKKVVTYVLVALVALLLGFIFLQNSYDGDSNLEVGPESAESELTGTTNYINYTNQTLVSTAGSKQVLFFHASWCSTCNEFEKQIKENGVPEGVTIVKADYDSDIDLRRKHKVTIQSTFVLLDSDGNAERTWPFGSGLRSMQDLYDDVLEI